MKLPSLNLAAKWSARSSSALAGVAFLILVPHVEAGLPEPDAVFYGSIALDGALVTAANTNIIVELHQSENGPAVITYRMGDEPAVGDRYILRAPVESGSPVANPVASALGDPIWLVVRQGDIERDREAYTITVRGEFVNLNFGDADSDGDGMSDAYETLYFGSTTGGDPAADPDQDGRPNRREFWQGTNPLTVDGRHPADLQPADNGLNIQEVTEYALAWKLGENWTVEPLTIPVDYVTRATALWVAGERYLLDNDPPTTAPLWWVSDPTPVPPAAVSLPAASRAVAHLVTAPDAEPVRAELLAAAEAWSPAHGSARARHGISASNVERALPWNYVPNQAFTVTLTVTPGTGTRAFAVEESPPPGWLVRFITASGRWDARNRLIKWGPFNGASAQTLSYEVTPLAATAAGGFVGVGSFDGSSVATAGRLAVFPPGAGPVGTLAVHSGPAGTYLILTGAPDQTYFVETGAELGVWSPAEPVTTDAQGLARWELAPGNEVRFFRLQSQ